MYNVSDKFKEYVKNNGYIEKRAKSAKEPVAKLKWSDFELEPLKPNLIKNGWDDFEAYGGDVLLETYNIESPEKSGNNIFNVEAESGQTIYIYREMWFKNAKPTENPLLTMVYEDDSKQYLNLDYLEDRIRLSDDTIMYVYKVELKKNLKRVESYKDYNWAASVKIDAIIKKIVVGTIVVIKTPLGNGLTRIQTWGGNHRIKLAKIYADTPNEGDKRSVSFYVKNLNGRTILRTHNTSQTNTIIKENGEGFYEETHTIPREFGEGWATVWSDKTDDNLDFIASDPIIVEGDEPNPTMIVDDLGNGKSKVRVFGANENTKLVHRSTKGIKGEPYTVKTNIDNKGNQLQLDTNLDEQSETIKKGNNDVKLEGKLKDNNIEIKLGRG